MPAFVAPSRMAARAAISNAIDIALARLIRLQAQLHAGKLTRAAGLLLVRVVDLGAPRQRLTVGNLGSANAHIDLMRAAQNVDLDVEV